MRNVLPLVMLSALSVFPVAILAQDVSSCQVELGLLTKELAPTLDDFQAGATVYLNDDYLASLPKDIYAGPLGEIRCFEYVRPASRKELRKGRIVGSRQEIIGPDKNVYGPRLVSSYAHFFKIDGPFAGSFDGEWKRQELVLPLGLVPTTVAHLAGLPLTVLDRNNDWLLLDERGTLYVFYFGGPELDEVFDSQALREQLSARQSAAEQLLDLELLVVHPDDTLTGQMLRENAWIWADEFQEGETVAEILSIDRSGTSLIFENQPLPIVLNEAYADVFFDQPCVDQIREDYLDSLLLIIAKQEYQLEQFAQANPSEWLNNENLKAHLSGRFGPQVLSQIAPVYHHLGFPSYDPRSCIYPEVGANGALVLVSRFVSDSGLYHTDIQVSIGNKTLNSSRVPPYDSRSSRSYLGTQIMEEVRFGRAEDQAIMEALAKSGEQTIKVKFITGGSYQKEITLPQVYRSLIRDAWLYSQLLKSGQER